MPRIKDFLPGAEPQRPAPEPAPEDDDLLGRPVMIGGRPTDFYPISSLAVALNRSPNTLRDWERHGVIPRGYVINADSRNGRRRLYTRTQILMLRRLAAECDVLDNPRATVKDSEFSRLAFVLFERLSREDAA